MPDRLHGGLPIAAGPTIRHYRGVKTPNENTRIARPSLLPLLWLLLVPLMAGCSASLPPVDHGPDRMTPVTDSTALSELSDQQLGADSGQPGFLMLDSGRDALLARAALIEMADERLDAQYYIWDDDHSGRYLASRLVAAANRGVQVRLLLDDINVSGKESLFSVLDAHPRINVRIFNPAKSRDGVGRWLSYITEFDRINRRMHNKTFVVDGAFGITGGRNIGDGYFDEHPAINFRDRDMLVLGSLVSDMTGNFEAYWHSRWSYPLEQLYPQPKTPETARAELVQAHRQASGLRASPPLDRASARALLEKSLAGLVRAPGRLVFDPPPEDPEAPADNVSATARALFEVVESAESEVLIESAYLILADDQLMKLDTIGSPDVKVAALTNSLATNDLVTNHSGYVRWRREMLEHGMELYELRPDAPACQRWVETAPACSNGAVSLHSKAVVVDSETLFVGSFNVNQRSMYLNGETVLIIQSPELASAVARDLRRAMKPENSWQVTIDEGGDLKWNGGDQVSSHEPETGFWRRAMARVLSWLPIEKYL